MSLSLNKCGNDGVGHPIRAVFNDLNLTTLCAGIVNAFIEAVFETEEEVEEEAEELAHTGHSRQKKCYPGPIIQNGTRAGFYHGIARDFEIGSNFLNVLRSHRGYC
jgi:hypothetical protein